MTPNILRPHGELVKCKRSGLASRMQVLALSHTSFKHWKIYLPFLSFSFLIFKVGNNNNNIASKGHNEDVRR